MTAAAGGMLAATAACADQPHDVTCGAFLRMPGDGQQAVTESFLDDHPIGRTVFGPDGSGQIEAAESALLGYCQQHPDENIKDLEPDLVPGF